MAAIVVTLLASSPAAFTVPVLAQRPCCPGPRLFRSQLRLCADELDAAAISSLYASLNERRSFLSSRIASAKRERELVASLAENWPDHERAQASLWQHWFAEEGEVAQSCLHEADGDDTALWELIERYPDWAEPTNRLATLRCVEGEPVIRP